MQASVIVIVLLFVLVAQATLTTRIARIRARVGHLEREQGGLSRNVATVQGWTEQQLRAVRGEFTVARVNDSAAHVLELRAHKRGTSRTSLPQLGDEDGEATGVFEPDPPLYALRSSLMRPPAPLAHPDLIGREDIAEEAAQPPLGLDEKTPPRQGRAAMLVATSADSEKGGSEWQR